MEKQLDEREQDGLSVELCYDDTFDEVVIHVADRKFGDYFSLWPPKDRVREYFDHPFAFRPYAHERGLLTQPTTGSELVSDY
jgi:hypothetical protein